MTALGLCLHQVTGVSWLFNWAQVKKWFSLSNVWLIWYQPCIWIIQFWHWTLSIHFKAFSIDLKILSKWILRPFDFTVRSTVIHVVEIVEFIQISLQITQVKQILKFFCIVWRIEWLKGRRNIGCINTVQRNFSIQVKWDFLFCKIWKCVWIQIVWCG